MRNPGESPEGRVQSETSSEGTIVPPSSPMPSIKFSRSDLVICNFIAYRNVWFYLAYAKGSDRDECDSPPCKRLKQGQLLRNKKK